MQILLHDPRALKELRRASITLKDSILAHIITQLNWGQVGKKGSVFPALPIIIRRPERRERSPMYCSADAFESFSKTFSYQTHPPLHSDRVQLFGKYLIVWPCVFETWRTSGRSCFFRSSPGLLLFFVVFFFSLLVQSWWTLQRTGCDRRRRFVWNLPQFREKGISVLCVCVCVSKDSGGGPLPLAFLPQGTQPIQGFHPC